MVKQKQSKRQRDIKTKLMAAICMLLVSSIMMVSTTYAWFTLSTAPEVTGITTAVGANGSLEIALLPKSGSVNDITSAAGDSVLADEARNVTWGNLVDLSDTSIYGLDQITLFPSALNAAVDGNGNPTSISTAAMLLTPSYGADGRVSQLEENTLTAYYDSQTQSFTPNEDYGVRAVGTASGMTDRQLSYRNARAAANSAKAQAATLASQSLNNNGSALANIAIARGTNGTGATFTQADVDAMQAIVDDLQKDKGILDQLETAYMQYILGYAASAASGNGDDTAWGAVKNEVEKAGATPSSVLAALTGAGIEVPAALSTPINALNATINTVSAANGMLAALDKTDESYTWTELQPILTELADPDAMLVNGIEASKIMDGDNMNKLVGDVAAGNGIVVTMASGGGVYADVADHSGDYTASVSIEKVEYGGLTLGPLAARMNTKSNVPSPYLSLVSDAVAVAGAPAGGGAGSVPISDMFGYIIDMAFQTNASNSDLLLQVDAVDRIYSSNETGAEVDGETTMGGGSSMTFASTTTDFSNDAVKGLMKAIRIVFFQNDGSNTVVATAKLDVDNATIGTDGITAPMYLYTLTGASGTGETYRLAGTGETATHVAVTTTTYEEATEGATHIADAGAADGYRVADTGAGEVATHKAVTTTTYREATADDDSSVVLYIKDTSNTSTSGETRSTDNVLMPLNQSTPTSLSVLVYLDGNNITNADVAATASTSMTGKMNLQFASSATLVPMEYTPLQTSQGAATTETVAP